MALPPLPQNVPSDLEIAQAHRLKPIVDIAESVGLSVDDLDLYGKWKAKVHLDVLYRLADRPNGKYVDVTAITPTPLGEGKTVTTIGLSQGLGYVGQEGHHLHPAAVHGPDLRHQGRSRRRRVRPGRPDGGLQPPPDRRHPRRRRRSQPARRGHRLAHAPRRRAGRREADQGLPGNSASEHRPLLHYLDPGGRRVRPGLAQRHHRPGRQRPTGVRGRPATTSPSPPRSWPSWPSSTATRACATCASAWDASSSARTSRASR